MLFFVDRVIPPIRWRPAPSNRRGPPNPSRPPTQLDNIEAGMGQIVQAVNALINQQAILMQGQLELIGSVNQIRRNQVELLHTFVRQFNKLNKKVKNHTQLLAYVSAEFIRANLINPGMDTHTLHEARPHPFNPDFQSGSLDKEQAPDALHLHVEAMSPNSAKATFNRAVTYDDADYSSAMEELSLHP